MSVLVVTAAGSPLTSEEAVKAAGADSFDDSAGLVIDEFCSSEAPELALWLDYNLAQSGMLELLTPGISPTVVLVEEGKGSNAAGQVQKAVDHLRTINRDWLTVKYRKPDGTWE